MMKNFKGMLLAGMVAVAGLVLGGCDAVFGPGKSASVSSANLRNEMQNLDDDLTDLIEALGKDSRMDVDEIRDRVKDIRAQARKTWKPANELNKVLANVDGDLQDNIASMERSRNRIRGDEIVPTENVAEPSLVTNTAMLQH